MSGNAYLESDFSPVQQEHTLADLPVAGAVAEHLDGHSLRNVPNPLGEVDPTMYHWFMGDGMVRGIRLRGGRAEWYRSRWVRSPNVSAQLGEKGDSAQKHRSGLGALGANTNVLEHAGRTLALVEGGVNRHELIDTLDTVGLCDFDRTLPGGYTAHPKRDPRTGELHTDPTSSDAATPCSTR